MHCENDQQEEMSPRFKCILRIFLIIALAGSLIMVGWVSNNHRYDHEMLMFNKVYCAGTSGIIAEDNMFVIDYDKAYKIDSDDVKYQKIKQIIDE